MQVVLINECKSCEISNEMLFNNFFFISEIKRQTGCGIIIAK